MMHPQDASIRYLSPQQAASGIEVAGVCSSLKPTVPLGTHPPLARNPSVPITMVQAINEALHQGMAQNPNTVLMGEDVGVNGGVFRVTEGLFDTFGAERVIDTPLSETAIVGAAVGMAVAGLMPIIELQFADYMLPAFDQLLSEVAKMRYRSGGDCVCPMVIRAPYGGGIRGGLYHSQSPEAYFAHTPGLKVVIPSSPSEAKGLLLSAMQSPDPVVFLEPKRIYRSQKELVSGAMDALPIGPARLVQQGESISVFCYGAMVEVVQKASQKLTQETGATVEIVDLRTLSPVDEQAIVASVQKTGRAVVVYEAPKTAGYGAEVSAIIAEQAIDSLKAPVKRVAGFDTPFPYTLEAVYLPHPARVLRVMQDVLAFE
jgi:pyruvate dehydrogenase E1 component beta subunit